MKHLLKTIVLLAIFSFTTTTNAQFFKKLGDKVTDAAEKAVTRKVEKKTEKTTEAAMDSILSPKERRKKKRQEQTDNESNSTGVFGDMMEEMMNPKEVNIEASYSFPITATIKFTNLKRNGRVAMMTQAYGDNALYSITEDAKDEMITDFANEAVIMLNEKKKEAQTMSLSWMKKMTAMGENNNEEESNASFTKTGNTKTINGYNCHEYRIVDNDLTVVAWFTPDVPFNYKDYIQNFAKMVGNTMDNMPVDTGYIMLMDMYEKEEHQYKMEVTSISESPITIDLSKYNVSSMMGN